MRVYAVIHTTLHSAGNHATGRSFSSRVLDNYHVPKATQVILVIELYDTSFSYHMEDFVSYRTLKFYAIRKYSFYLLTNEIVVILSTE